jgi:aspartate/methionine/tyrosine aminotransferase
LQAWVQLSGELRCSLIFDEFYSHYLHGEAQSACRNGKGSALSACTNSAARFVDDVNADPVLIVDGLTKNWRYPGLRLSWTLGPAPVIEAITSAGSFLDGGAPHPVQEMVVALLDPSIADLEAQSIQAEFSRKRRLMIDRIRKIGFVLENEPLGGFYCFGPSMPGLELGMNRLADLYTQS